MTFLKQIAEVVSKYPKLKSIAKKNYQHTAYLIFKKQYKYKTLYPMKKISLENNESFFGYYDKSPLNSSNEFLIYHSTPYIGTEYKPSPKIPIQIVLFDIVKNKHTIIAHTFAYNWQQGSKLQWLTNSRFIYNNYYKNVFISKVFDVSTMNFVKILPYPIYDCYKYKFAITLNFSRLNLLAPDYGYRNIFYEDILDIDNDGIFYIDMKNDTKSLLISLRNLIELKSHKSFINAYHSINHIMLNTTGDKFIFIHRWYSKNLQRFDRLLVSDIKGKNIEILADFGKVSHCCWLNEKEIIGFLRNSDKRDGFYKIDIETKKINIFSSILINLGDGHPSICSNYMIFDSYPDKSRMKKLFTYNIKSQKFFKIGEFFEPIYYFGETRCDLHPRFSYDGKMIFFDSTHEGKRFLYYTSF